MDCGERTWYVCVLCGAVNMVRKHGMLVAMAAIVSNMARQTRFIVSHQHPLPLRPATSTVIIAFQAVTCPLLMAVVPQICGAYIAVAVMNNE